jgi:hypothetical protein
LHTGNISELNLKDYDIGTILTELFQIKSKCVLDRNNTPVSFKKDIHTMKDMDTEIKQYLNIINQKNEIIQNYEFIIKSICNIIPAFYIIRK